MAQDKQHFPIGKVKAFKAYFEQSRKSAKGKPEYGDLETTVKLCEQLIALMEPAQETPVSNAAGTQK
jgi:hypothetical protein